MNGTHRRRRAFRVIHRASSRPSRRRSLDALRLDPVFEAVQLPARVPRLDPGLADVNGDHLAHGVGRSAPSFARLNSRHRPIRRGVRGRRRAIRGRCGDDALREVPLETFAGRSASRWSPSSPSSLSHDPSIEAAPAHRVAMRWPSTRRRGDRVDATVAADPPTTQGARDDARGRARARARARATRQGARARRGEGRRRGRGRAPRAGARGR
jgi:hypothetical protein